MKKCCCDAVAREDKEGGRKPALEGRCPIDTENHHARPLYLSETSRYIRSSVQRCFGLMEQESEE